MTLGNMRENGVRSLAITCGALHCDHQSILDVSVFSDDVTVPSSRMVCTVCGAIGADARPNWNERAPLTVMFCVAFADRDPRGIMIRTPGEGVETESAKKKRKHKCVARKFV